MKIEHDFYNKKQVELFLSELKDLKSKIAIKTVSQEVFDATLKYYTKRLEMKIAAAKGEILKWFIGASIAQSSLLIALLIGVLDFLVQKG